ncbi:putative GH25 family protein [Povalibacter uvarum]|uniref:Putative GH25 family protein n=1 Tax=Povalibacter uvarum TaxID=732238 RepID=A0A841HVV3_9GAMM|nr:DUF4198 domain-containing protein [Povalibacter uvarum]MBB6096330.1 putative GH25 family protein [Povalibacter uvarum]
MIRSLAAIAVTASFGSNAHDFWIQPATFSPRIDEAVSITLLVGDPSSRQRSQIKSKRITRFDSIGPSGERTDRRGVLTLHEPQHDGELRWKAPGTHVLILETDNRAESYLPAEKFNAYLAEEGLTPALRHRQLTGRTVAEGSERYSRRAKMLVQVGGAADSNSFSMPTGLSLELVPEANPYATPPAARLPLRVIHEGQPLAGALVKMIDLRGNLTVVDRFTSDAAGRGSFAMPSDGEWIVSVTWTRVLPEAEEVDFETVFSTLSFGFSPGTMTPRR